MNKPNAASNYGNKHQQAKQEIVYENSLRLSVPVGLSAVMSGLRCRLLPWRLEG